MFLANLKSTHPTAVPILSEMCISYAMKGKSLDTCPSSAVPLPTVTKSDNDFVASFEK